MAEVFKLTGLDGTMANLRRLTQAIGDNILKKAVKKAIDPITASMKDFVPIGAEDEHGGLLRDSIGQRITNKQGSVRAIAGPRTKFKVPIGISKKGRNKGKVYYKIATRYAHLVEYGGSKMPAQPFMRPAWAEDGGEVALNTFLYELKKGVDEEVAKLPKVT